MKFKGISFSVFILFLTSCSSHHQQNEGKGNIYPSSNFPVPPALPLPSPGLGMSSETNADDEVSYTSLRTIMAQNSRVLTVWALAEGNWLWAYGSAASSSFGGVRNWRVVPVNKGEKNIFRFVNGVTGTCIEAYKNGLVHSACNSENSAQDFLLIPATNGGVFIKNPVLNKCVRYDIVTHTIYSTVYLTECVSGKDKSYDQVWYIAPALTNTIPLP
ncbi:cytolethal distending toxin subunit A [Salmonella enterica subsp. diarizonae]|uniref:Cytolethal distending toxin subunit A n=1 Tax=Salmonella diarizonae TaxID=59204 RepID=A0A5U3CXD5_SALDZ|nr:cytolethal distending toxin subunit A [Salmonella enterica]EBP3414589.1 cytolethal distending toxin subunit A [Salmonella enterica subsp. diarizonae]EBP3696620.1 cytolethal distending toxin subunit A [Salmonella enterica subsp. diarizonae]EBQ6944925.1 cytolethal distending toxin subunit A [Salmonella enterica subsp. diarizonae]ECO1718156.1 cytolethal distending toxin subunit A [Salmonella enterica]